MAVTVKEWVQREWTQSRVDLYDREGDFYNLSGLSPNITHRTLKRSPAWSSHLTHSGLTAVKAMFYDEALDRYVLFGTNAASHLASTYFSSAWSHVATTWELSAATSGPGGLSMRNVAYFGDYIYVIGADSKVYRGTSYSGGLTEFYGTADAVCLGILGGRMYVAHTYGKISRLDDDNLDFEDHYDSIANFDPLFITGFRGYLLIVGKQRDGSIHLYSLPQTPIGLAPTSLREIAALPSENSDFPATGPLFAVHQDKLYFSPGRYLNPDGANAVDIYSFNGSQIKRIAQLPDTAASPITAGLVTWRGELLFYAPTGDATQNYKMLVGDQFVDAIPGTINVTGLSAIAANLGGELVTVGLDGSSNHGIHHAGGSSLQDGHLVTARLDMDHPALQKRLDRIVVLLDGAETDFKVVIKYRTDNATAWTTATTGNNTQRAIASNIGAHFYTLQLRIELDDDTVAGDQDIRILAVSTLYSIEGP